MELNFFAVPEMLSLIYEEMDVDTIEDRFVNLVSVRDELTGQSR